MFPPPHLTNARARAGGPTHRPHAAPPPAPQTRGGRSGSVLQQQQRTPASPPTVSQRARHAFSLYCECVAAGQWARLTIEQRPEGETFHVSSRPWAAAPAAARARTKEKKARRRPNKKRLAAKQLWRESRGSGPAAAVPRQQQQQQFCQPAVAATAASGTYAQVAASAASPAKTAASAVAAAHIGSLVSSPRLTRAAKKRKVLSPRDMDVAAFAQLDGVLATPRHCHRSL